MYNADDFYKMFMKQIDKESGRNDEPNKFYSELNNEEESWDGLAISVYDLYFSLMKVGFSKEQAFELTKLITYKSID